MVYIEVSTQCGLSVNDAKKAGYYREIDTAKNWSGFSGSYKSLFNNNYAEYLKAQKDYINANNKKTCFIEIIK